jgi:hypothetical protein
MASRFITRSILVIGLVFLMGTTAGARIGGQSTSQTGCTQELHDAGFCSIEVEGLLTGLGNVTNVPTAYAVTVRIQEGKVYCKNPAGGNLEGNGVPFRGAITLEGGDTINAGDVTKNGKSLKEIVFHDAQMIQAVVDSGAVTAEEISCPNPGWTQIILVKQLQVLGEQFTDPTEPTTCDLNSDPLIIDTTCTLVDALGTQCTAPAAPGGDDKNLVWQQFTYACTKLCHNSNNQFPDCPAAPPIPTL